MARFFVSTILIIFGLKRTNEAIKDKICLNHFISDNNLKINLYSLYNAQTYARLVPIFANRGLWKRFVIANNWIKKYTVHGFGKYEGDIRCLSCRNYRVFVRSCIEIVLSVIGCGFVAENFLKALQTRRIKKDPRTHKSGGRVLFNDAQIEFHPDSSEQKMLDSYNQKLKQLDFFDFKLENNSGLR
jgi:hypothetical protein